MGDVAKNGAPQKMATPVEAFTHDLRHVCGLFDVEPAHSDGLVIGDVGVSRLARLDVAHVKLNAKNVSRGPKRVRADPGEHFFAIMQVEGHCTIKQNGISNRIQAGEICLVDSSLPSNFIYDGVFSHQVSFHLPRQELLSRFGSYWRQWQHLSASKDWVPALSAVCNQLLNAGEHKVQHHLEESFFSLIGAALCQLDSGSSKPSSPSLSHAINLIETHCADPAFSSVVLAERMGLSARSLQRQFQQIDATPTKRILDARLHRAYNTLQSRAPANGVSVTDVAFDSGFSDLSYFHREFRKKFGKTPGALIRIM